MFTHPRGAVLLTTGLLLLTPAVAAGRGAFTSCFETFPSNTNAFSTGWYGQAADLDGDGKDELITSWTNYDVSASAVFVQVRSFGSGMWDASKATAIRVAWNENSYPGRTEAADLDSDGDLDLIVPAGDTLVIVPNLGSGSFGAPIFLYEPGNYGVAAADFDRDGLVDLALTRYDTQRVRILHATAPFTYTFVEEHPTRRFTEYVNLADLNDDSFLDLVVSADTASTVLLGNGAGGFTSFEVPIDNAVPAGDLNGDGRGDLLSLSASYLGNGDGTFQPALPFPPLVANTTTDMNEDGKLDLVGIKSGTPFSLMSVQLGLGDGTFGAATLFPYSRGGTNVVLSGDFDGDGHRDIAQPSRNALDGIMFGLGNGQFPVPISVPNPMSPRYMKAGEFGSGTGKDLLLVSRAANSMTLRLRTGLAQWSVQDTLILPGTPGAWGPEVADLNGDGRDDVVLAYDNLSTISYWLTDAPGHLGPRTDLPSVDPVVPKTREIAVGDVDGDGDADILYQRFASGGVYDNLPLGWYEGSGAGTFTYHGTLPHVSFGNLEIGDLNGDGVPDLAMVNIHYGIRTLIATAPGTFGPYTDLAPLDVPFFAEHFVKGKLDAGSSLDLSLQNNRMWMFRANGDGTFAAPFSLPREAGFGTSGYTADLDGDGRDEIINGTQVIRLAADGTMESVSTYGAHAGGSGLTVTMDVDDNGALDLVTASSSDQSLKMLLNRASPQVLGVGPPGPGTPGLRLSASSNPVRGRVVLRLGSTQAGSVALELLDIQGRRVGAASARVAIGNSVTVSLGDAAKLAPGVYLAVARQSDRTAVTRISVLR